MEAGLAHHQAGRLAEAEADLAVLAAAPGHADALHLLGIIAYQGGRHEVAIELIGEAIQQNRDNPSYHTSCGLALAGLSRLDEALDSYGRALALEPNNAEALNNRGLVLQELGHFDEALESYDKALAARSDFAEALSNRGNILQLLNRAAEAVGSYDHALTLKPNLAATIHNRGEALENPLRLSLLAYTQRLNLGAIEYPHYGYCIFQAAKLATSLNYKNISIIEFGCGGGNGLVSAEMHIAEVMKLFNIQIDLYGFDIGLGLPSPQDYRDLPYYFQAGSFEMDRQALERKLERAKLVIGNVKHTCGTFFDQHDAAPIGCIFNDLDFYSSTRDALTLLDAGESHFLPRTFIYFDDIVGDDTALYNEFTGEQLAIREFNQSHDLKKIAKHHYLPFKFPNQPWANSVFICHDFAHPRYNDFVADTEQRAFRAQIKLRSGRS